MSRSKRSGFDRTDIAEAAGIARNILYRRIRGWPIRVGPAERDAVGLLTSFTTVMNNANDGTCIDAVVAALIAQDAYRIVRGISAFAAQERDTLGLGKLYATRMYGTLARTLNLPAPARTPEPAEASAFYRVLGRKADS